MADDSDDVSQQSTVDIEELDSQPASPQANQSPSDQTKAADAITHHSPVEVLRENEESEVHVVASSRDKGECCDSNNGTSEVNTTVIVL